MFDAGVGGPGGDVSAHVSNGGGWREIDRQMRRLARRRAALDAEEAELLVAAKRAEIHKYLGYGSFIEYLERVCGYAPTTAHERIRVAEALETLPVIREALAGGDVTYSAVRELSRVARPDTEAEWLAAIEGCTVREIEDVLRGHAPGDRPGDPRDPDLEPRVVRLELTPQAYALFLEAHRHVEATAGETVTDSDFIEVACRAVMDDGSTRSKSNHPPYQISLSVCPDCERGWQQTGSRAIEVSPAVVERMRCDAVELGRVDGAVPDERSRSIPDAVRRAVLARDGHRCTIPGCRSSRYVHVHHIIYRSKGGEHALMNLTTLCTLHHTSVHDGRIVVSGTAGALVVTHADGRPYGVAPPETVAVPAVASPPRRALTSRPAPAPASACADPAHGELMATAQVALVQLGFKPAEARAAVARAISHVGSDMSLEALLRASLRECPRQRS